MADGTEHIQLSHTSKSANVHTKYLRKLEVAASGRSRRLNTGIAGLLLVVALATTLMAAANQKCVTYNFPQYTACYPLDPPFNTRYECGKLDITGGGFSQVCESATVTCTVLASVGPVSLNQYYTACNLTTLGWKCPQEGPWTPDPGNPYTVMLGRCR